MAGGIERGVPQDFLPLFFSSILQLLSSDSYPKLFFNANAYSPKNSDLKATPDILETLRKNSCVQLETLINYS
jgi:hypothetical protein